MAIKVAKVSGGGSGSRRINITNWRKGYVSFVDGVRRDNSSLDKSVNLMLTQDGVVTKRWGTKTYGDELPAGTVNGATRFAKFVRGTSVIEDWLLVVVDGRVYVSRDGGGWRQVTGDELSPNRELSFENTEEKVFMANGKDPLAFYDILEDKVKRYQKLDQPQAPTASLQGDLQSGDVTAFYQITAVNDIGETKASKEVMIKISKQRATWINEKDKVEAIKLTWPAVPNAKRYNIYYSDASEEEVYLDSVASNAYTDDARMNPNMAIAAPKDDTTGGPIVSILAYADNRIWGVGDPENPYRVYFGGVGAMTTAFSPFYGGGYVDVVKGGPYFPTLLAGYRDGRGENSNVLFAGGSDDGSQYQISLQSMTVGTSTFIVPTVARVIGSLGTSSPRSVVEVKNNLYYASVKSFNTTGAKPDMMNVLTTDEISLAIRKDVRRIGALNARKIAATYFDGKIMWAVAVGDTENNEVWILDTEISCWMLPWRLPVKYFIKHTDINGKEHLLFLPSRSDDRFSKNQLVELSDKFDTDNGREFDTHFSTGIIPMDSSHMEWAKIKKVYTEFLNAFGEIELTISGDMKNKDFSKNKIFRIANQAVIAGWDNQLWNGFCWNSAPTIPAVLTPETLKKVIKIQKKLNNVRIEIKAKSKSGYGLSVLSLEAAPKKVSDPSEWKK